jgi:hypothetical protein
VKKKALHQDFPRGWNEKKIREVIAFYDAQTDEEGAAEIDAAEDVAGETWMSVPTELVPAVARLIAKHQQQASNTRPRKSRGGKTRSKSTRPRISARR